MATAVLGIQLRSSGEASPSSPAGERLELILAGERVVTESGFCQLNVRSVCREAGTSTHRFYDHFSGKADLIAAMLEKQFVTATRWVTGIIEPIDHPGDRVWAIVNTLLELGFDRKLERPASVFALHVRDLTTYYRESLDKHTALLLAPMVAAIREADGRGLLNSPDPEMDAMTIFSLIVGVVFDRPTTGDENGRQEVEQAVQRFISRGLGLSLKHERG